MRVDAPHAGSLQCDVAWMLEKGIEWRIGPSHAPMAACKWEEFRFFSRNLRRVGRRVLLSLSLSLSNAALPPLMCTGLHTPRFAALARLARTTVTQAAAVAGECVEAGGWGPNQFSFAPA